VEAFPAASSALTWNRQFAVPDATVVVADVAVTVAV
jgi:hypothetical protein